MSQATHFPRNARLTAHFHRVLTIAVNRKSQKPPIYPQCSPHTQDRKRSPMRYLDRYRAAMSLAACLAVAWCHTTVTRAQDYFSDQPVEIVQPINFELGERLAGRTSSPSSCDAMTCDSIGCESALDDCTSLACRNSRRSYATGILGVSFANLDIDDGELIDDSLMTAGGAIGLEYELCNGSIRAEIEARGRQNLGETLSADEVFAKISAENIWSTTVNVWRDFCVNERLSIYGGGGLGAGGYDNVFKVRGFLGDIDVNDSSTHFAWQVGAGVTYDINCRMSLDLGYRFFSMAGTTADGSWTIDTGSSDDTGSTGRNTFDFSYDTQLSASELVLSLRIYDPFKGLRRCR